MKKDLESIIPTNHNSSNSNGASSPAPSSTNPPVEEKRLIMQDEVEGREEPTISTIEPKFDDDQVYLHANFTYKCLLIYAFNIKATAIGEPHALIVHDITCLDT